MLKNPEFWEIPESQSSEPNSPPDVKFSPSEDFFREPKFNALSNFEHVQTSSPAAVSNLETCSFSSQDSPNKVILLQ